MRLLVLIYTLVGTTYWMPSRFKDFLDNIESDEVLLWFLEHFNTKNQIDSKITFQIVEVMDHNMSRGMVG